MEDRRAYTQRYPCPKCGSLDTGTDTIATSKHWMEFDCAGCGHQFRKKAANISSLSKKLSRLSAELGPLT
jgi:transcription elongation factor Elf1